MSFPDTDIEKLTSKLCVWLGPDEVKLYSVLASRTHRRAVHIAYTKLSYQLVGENFYENFCENFCETEQPKTGPGERFRNIREVGYIPSWVKSTGGRS